MTVLRRVLAVVAVLCAQPLGAEAEDAPKAAGQTWFTPPPGAKTQAPTLDLSRSSTSETITIIARRPTRSWRVPPETGLAPTPMASDYSHRPWSTKSFTPPSSYCNSSLRNVGGQPANGHQTMAGVGAGAC
jgi:hypothetical protein